jgi:hypothetical protein
MQEDEKTASQSIIDESFIPAKQWFSLDEACALKGLNYKTACNRKFLQPNGGMAESKIGGRKKFSRATVLQWLLLSDTDLE